MQRSEGGGLGMGGGGGVEAEAVTNDMTMVRRDGGEERRRLVVRGVEGV